MQYARRGEVVVTDAFTVPSGPVPGSNPLVNAMTMNICNIDDAEVRGLACDFDGIIPVDARHRVSILMNKDCDPSLPAVPVPNGSGRICLDLNFIGGAAD